ncbi:MAG TPA: hypothetical protein VMZ53_18635 [Kofleriaceae bacterium]|nr:hypothetical protein [Kofleriaceae bacterium]
MRPVVLACVLAGCGVSGPGDVAPPTAAEESAANQAAEDVSIESPGDSITVDLDACANQRLFAWLPLGSMWILVHRRDGDHCELWLGGETEDPSYNGAASQYCLFYRQGTLDVEVRNGGPARVDEPSCIDL